MGDVASLVTAVVAVVALIAGYVQFVLRTWLLPSVEFDVAFTPLCTELGGHIGEVACVVKNTGANMLVITRIRCRMSYRVAGEGRWLALGPPDASEKEPSPRHELVAIEPGFQHPIEPDAVHSDWLLILPPRHGGPAGFSTSLSSGSVSATQSTASGATNDKDRDRTFVQPGATQAYRKPIVLPVEAQLLHVWGAFDYQINMSRLSSWLVGVFNRPPRNLDWRRGVQNHTVRRTFTVTT